MGMFDWLGKIPPPQQETSSKELEAVQATKEDVSTYSDKGVSFKGRARKQVGADQFTRVNQNTRFFSVGMSNKAAGATTTISRVNKDKETFFCNRIFVQLHGVWGSIMDFVDLFDGTVSNPRFRMFLVDDTHPADTFFVSFDLGDCPREFSGDILIKTSTIIGVGEVVAVNLFGWDEEK